MQAFTAVARAKPTEQTTRERVERERERGGKRKKRQFSQIGGRDRGVQSPRE